MTIYRMRLREDLVRQMKRGRGAANGADRSGGRVTRETIFPAHTHTQPAQPTTVAHYLLAVIEELERDARAPGRRLRGRQPESARRLRDHRHRLSDFDRERTSDLLGFDGPTGNTYGSIATVDYLLESAARGRESAWSSLGRVAQDLLLWCTVEVGYLRLADGLVQSSSIMPQKRNPVALEHARSLASKRAGAARRPAARRPQHAVRRHRRHRRRPAAARGRRLPRCARAPRRCSRSWWPERRSTWRGCARAPASTGSRSPSWPTRWRGITACRSR